MSDCSRWVWDAKKVRIILSFELFSATRMDFFYPRISIIYLFIDQKNVFLHFLLQPKINHSIILLYNFKLGQMEKKIRRHKLDTETAIAVNWQKTKNAIMQTYSRYYWPNNYRTLCLSLSDAAYNELNTRTFLKQLNSNRHQQQKWIGRAIHIWCGKCENQQKERGKPLYPLTLHRSLLWACLFSEKSCCVHGSMATQTNTCK